MSEPTQDQTTDDLLRAELRDIKALLILLVDEDRSISPSKAIMLRALGLILPAQNATNAAGLRGISLRREIENLDKRAERHVAA